MDPVMFFNQFVLQSLQLLTQELQENQNFRDLLSPDLSPAFIPLNEDFCLKLRLVTAEVSSDPSRLVKLRNNHHHDEEQRGGPGHLWPAEEPELICSNS